MNDARGTLIMLPSPTRFLHLLLGLAAALQLGGCGTAPSALGADANPQLARESAEANYGIKVEALHLSAAGSMLDFRYRVVDPKKAAPLLDGKMKPYLIDDARGARLGVPSSPVLGGIRQTSRNNHIEVDRTYFIMFGNPGKALHSGDKVTLVLGDLKIADLQVR
jgi:hypothetical protein